MKRVKTPRPFPVLCLCAALILGAVSLPVTARAQEGGADEPGADEPAALLVIVDGSGGDGSGGDSSGGDGSGGDSSGGDGSGGDGSGASDSGGDGVDEGETTALLLLDVDIAPLAAAVLDLDDFDPTQPGDFMWDGSISQISYYGTGALTVQGVGQYTLYIWEATDVTLAAETQFGANGSALVFSTLNDADVTVTGAGGGIVLNGALSVENGSLTVEGEIEAIHSAGRNHGIVAYGDVALNGDIGGIDAGISGVISGMGSVTIGGEVGDITAGSAYGITADGDVAISGSVGDISAGYSGISSNGTLMIDGDVGDITADSWFGIHARDGVAIGGSVGDIAAGYYGIFAETGSVAIDGSVGGISAEYNGITSGAGVTVTGEVGDITADAGMGIYGNGGITLGGRVGSVHADDIGIASISGGVTISGEVGDITSVSGDGINGHGDVALTGSIGGIDAATSGILANSGSVTLGGSVGDIAAGFDGICAYAGVTIGGTVGTIRGGGTYSDGIGIFAIDGVTILTDVTVSGGEDYGAFEIGPDGLTIRDSAVVYADSIDPDYAQISPDSVGILFAGNEGTVYGDVTLKGDLTVPAGSTLTVPEGSTLTVPDGAALTGRVVGSVIYETAPEPEPGHEIRDGAEDSGSGGADAAAPVLVSVALTGAPDASGHLAEAVTGQMIREAIARAMAEAVRLGRNSGGIALSFVNNASGVRSLTVALDAEAVALLKASGVVSCAFSAGGISFTLGRAQIGALPDGGVVLTATEAGYHIAGVM